MPFQADNIVGLYYMSRLISYFVVKPTADTSYNVVDRHAHFAIVVKGITGIAVFAGKLQSSFLTLVRIG